MPTNIVFSRRLHFTVIVYPFTNIFFEMNILKPISHIHKIKSAREFHIFRNWKTNKKQHKFEHRLLSVEKEGSPILFNVCINNRRTRVFKGDEGSQVNKCQSPCSQIRQVRTYHIYWDIFFTSLVHTDVYLIIPFLRIALF